MEIEEVKTEGGRGLLREWNKRGESEGDICERVRKGESDGHAGRWRNRESERERVWEINPGELEAMKKKRTMSTRTRIRGGKTD